MALLHRLKQVQLDRALVLDSNGVADENEPALLSPALRLPTAFKVLAAASRSGHLPPQYALFDPFLEQNKALKRNRDRVFYTKFLQTLHHRVAEKGAVHAYLQSRQWKAFPDRFDAGGHIFHCAFGIVHVAGTVQHIEYLTGLRHGAKQRIVTARSFLLLVKANCRAFGIVPSAWRLVLCTLPSKSDVTVCNASFWRRSKTKSRLTACWTATLLSSNSESIRLTVGTLGSDFRLSTRLTNGSSR